MLISIILKYDLDIGRYFETHFFFIRDDAVDILYVDERLVYIPFVFVIGYLFLISVRKNSASAIYTFRIRSDVETSMRV
jgi:hypothetical protein